MGDKNHQQKIIGACNQIKGSRVAPSLRADVVFLVLLRPVTTNLAAGNNSDLFSQTSVGQTSELAHPVSLLRILQGSAQMLASCILRGWPRETLLLRSFGLWAESSSL